jgi:hypothetical protein
LKLEGLSSIWQEHVMIVSASRRTDIPAFYSQWFLNRLKAGEVMIRNPFNPRQVSRIGISRQTVDFIVFWTKNPASMMERSAELDSHEISYYYQFTVTPYGKALEPNLPDLKTRVEIFRTLSDMLGNQRVIWRYDPIIFTDEMDIEYHKTQFSFLARSFEGYTRRCVISFLHLYAKCRKNLKNFPLIEVSGEHRKELGSSLRETAASRGIEIVSCALEHELMSEGIKNGKCIDDELISNITGKNISVRKDRYQRAACNCVESIDVGMYNTCVHLCVYCYANSNASSVEENVRRHDPQSPLLIGALTGKDAVIEREGKSFFVPECEPA